MQSSYQIDETINVLEFDSLDSIKCGCRLKKKIKN